MAGKRRSVRRAARRARRSPGSRRRSRSSTLISAVGFSLPLAVLDTRAPSPSG